MPSSGAVLLCPQLVGREQESAVLVSLVTGLSVGQGAAVVLVGEPGIGKSRLAREVRDRADTAGVPVGVGRAREAAEPPYGVLAEALLAAARNAGTAGAPDAGVHRGQLGHLVPVWGAPGQVLDTSPAGLGEAILAATAVLGAGAGVLLVVEDLHWADDDTVDVVEYLADHAADSGLGLVVTTRPEDPVRLRRLRTWAGRGSLTYLPLDRLGDELAEDMARICLQARGDTPSPEAIHRVRELSGGLPLLVEDLAAAPALVETSLTVSRFADLVQAQAALLDEGARLVVDVAALLGPDIDWRRLVRCTGQPAEAVTSALRRAGSVQLVVEETGTLSYRFRHALTAEVLRAAMTPQRASELATGSADAIAAEDRPELEAPLRQLAGDDEGAAALFVRAAASADRRGALAVAEDHVRAAVALGRGGPPALLLLLQVLAHRGKDDEVLAVGAEVLDQLPREHRSAAAMLMVRACIARGDAVRGAALLAQSRLGHGPATIAEVALLEAHVALLTPRRDRLVAAEHLAHRAVAAAAEVGAPELLCEALEVAGRCARVRDLNAAGDAFRRALDVANVEGLELWRLRALNELGTVDMFRDVVPTRLQAARDAAAAGGALALEAGTEINLAAVHVMRAELTEARRSAERAEQLGRRIGRIDQAAAGLVFRGVVAAHEARFSDMQDHVRAAEALAGDDPDVVVGTWGMCRGMAGLLREDHDEAHHALGTAAARVADRPALAISPVAGPWLLLRAGRGEADLAELRTFQGEQAIGARWSTLWGSLAEACLLGPADTDRAVDAVARAVDAARVMPLFLAVGLRLAGGAAVAAGWGQPREWLDSAQGTFERYGHERAASACRTLLRQAGAKVARPRAIDAAVPPSLRAHGVTRREYEVLLLVAERLQNKEIGVRLFLSARTVEKHVASLHAKLGTADRADLVRRGAQTPPHDGQPGGEHGGVAPMW